MCGRTTSKRPVTEHALRVLGSASRSILSKINKIFPNTRFSLSICWIFFYNVLAQPLSRKRKKKKSRPSPVPLPGFEPRPAAAKRNDDTTVEPCILPTMLVVQFTSTTQTKYLKIDASHFKTAPRASVGGVEIGASRLRVSPPLPTLGGAGRQVGRGGRGAGGRERGRERK